MATMALRLHDEDIDIIDHVDLTHLTPMARALAEIWHTTTLHNRHPVWLVRAVDGQPGEPDHMMWDSWSRYPPVSTMPAAAYLEQQARRLPRGYAAVATGGVDPRVPSADAALAEAARLARLVTLDDLLAHLARNGRVIGKNTYTAYAARHQAPGPVEERRPALYSLDEADDWLRTRPPQT